MTAPRPTIGRYEIISPLGGGGFATVFRAWDPLLARQVALKVLLPHLSTNPEVCRRFVAEARAISALSHPNIVTFFDVGEAGGQPYFTMELIEGPTLVGWAAERGAVRLDDLFALLPGLCSAIDYLHSAGLVHRDIKASNVMIDPARGPVLMDFGVVRVVDETQFTRTGASIGTPAAMAPEQVLGTFVGPAADIYALGVLAYQALAGRPPFVGDTAYVLHAQAYVAPPPLREFRPDLPPSVFAAMDQALAKAPDLRPRSANAFLRQLRGELSSTPVSSSPPQAETVIAPSTLPQSGPPAKKRRPRWLIPAAALAAALAATAGLVGVLALVTSGTKPGPTAAPTSAATSATSAVASSTAPATATNPAAGSTTATVAGSSTAGAQPPATATSGAAVGTQTTVTATAAPTRAAPSTVTPAPAGLVNVFPDVGFEVASPTAASDRHDDSAYCPDPTGTRPVTETMTITRLLRLTENTIAIDFSLSIPAVPGMDSCVVPYLADTGNPLTPLLILMPHSGAPCKAPSLPFEGGGCKLVSSVNGFGITVAGAVNLYGRTSTGRWSFDGIDPDADAVSLQVLRQVDGVVTVWHLITIATR